MVVFDILYHKKNSEEIISKEAKFFYENCSISVHTLFGLNIYVYIYITKNIQAFAVSCYRH